MQLSVLIPARNEELTVGQVVREVRQAFTPVGVPFEILVISDGSTDRTVDEARAAGADRVFEECNGGYGATLKRGADLALGEWLVIIDADGTYPADAIPALWVARDGAQAVVGARLGRRVALAPGNRVAKVVLRLLLFMLVGRWVPDFNSGLQLIDAAVFRRFQPIFPARFSLTTTLSAALAINRMTVRYLPIDYHERVAPSKFLPVQDGLRLTWAMFRTTMLFRPARLALVLGGAVGLLLLTLQAI